MGTSELIVMLFITVSISVLINLFAGFILYWFRDPVVNTWKLKYFIKKGYVIARLIKRSKAVIEKVLLPNSDGIVKIEGKSFTINENSVLLKNARYPEYTFSEGETASLDIVKEVVETTLNCPECSKEIKVNVERTKNINPAVLDSLLLKMKIEGSILKWLKENKQIMYLLFGAIGVGALACFLIYDFQNRFGEIAGPVIKEACKSAFTQTINAK